MCLCCFRGGSASGNPILRAHTVFRLLAQTVPSRTCSLSAASAAMRRSDLCTSCRGGSWSAYECTLVLQSWNNNAHCVFHWQRCPCTVLRAFQCIQKKSLLNVSEIWYRRTDFFLSEPIIILFVSREFSADSKEVIFYKKCFLTWMIHLLTLIESN